MAKSCWGCAAARQLAATVTPQFQSWWIAGPLWIASAVFGWRYLFERGPDEGGLPGKRPKMAPVRYGRSDKDGAAGVVLKNQGDDAYDIAVPDVQVQDRQLVIAGESNHVAGGDELFVEMYVQTPQGSELDGVRSVMTQLGVREVEIVAHYRDFDHNWYTTTFTLRRNLMVDGGVQVGPFKQTRTSGPPKP